MRPCLVALAGRFARPASAYNPGGAIAQCSTARFHTAGPGIVPGTTALAWELK